MDLFHRFLSPSADLHLRPSQKRWCPPHEQLFTFSFFLLFFFFFSPLFRPWLRIVFPISGKDFLAICWCCLHTEVKTCNFFFLVCYIQPQTTFMVKTRLYPVNFSFTGPTVSYTVTFIMSQCTTVQSVNFVLIFFFSFFLFIVQMSVVKRKKVSKHFESTFQADGNPVEDGKLISLYDSLSIPDKKNSTVMNALSPNELKGLMDILNKESTPRNNTLQCILYTRNTSNGRGYVYLSRSQSRNIWWKNFDSGKTRKFLATHVALASIGSFKKHGQEASHLCKDKECVNVNHLVFEDAETNLSRNGCVPNREILCPCCSTHFRENVCLHWPHCLQ